MGRPKRLYPLGKYRIRIRNGADKEKTYPIELEYTWGLDTVRRTTNIHVKASDWNPKENQGRGEIRASYGNEYKRLNQVLINRVDRIDPQLAEYYEKHPNQITTEVIRGFYLTNP